MSLRNVLVFLIGLTFASQFALGQERLKKLNIKTYGDSSFFVTSFVENVLFQSGEIKADQYGEFRRAIVDNDIKIVVLNSEGGNVYESLNMAGTIFDRGISTYVPENGKCYSACAFMFFAGSERFSSGKLGVHQTSYGEEISDKKAKIGTVDSYSQLSTADIIQHLNEFNTPPKVYEWMLRTSPDEMYVFSQDEMKSLKINSPKVNIEIKIIEDFLTQFEKAISEDICDKDPAQCEDTQICVRASQDKVWRIGSEAELFVEEAKSRNLTCGVPKTCKDDVKVCTELEICQQATGEIDGRKYWKIQSSDQKYVIEAKLRGLDCEIKKISGSYTCEPLSPASCEDEELCRRATSIEVGILEWSRWDYAQNYVNEAKKRGLSCGVGEASGVSKSSKESLASYFKNQSLTKRKQIQYALKELGFYNMGIDGLWGNGTRKAFTAFKDGSGLNSHTNKYAVSVLLTRVKVPTTFSTPKKSYSSSSSSSGNNSNTGRKGWEPLSGNPKLSYDDASEICEAKAMAEYRSYINNNQPRDRNSSINCTGYGFNSYSCRSSSGGGWAAGVLEAWDEADNRNAGKKLAQATAKACMADYGWIKR